mmetsp:Transcript_20763/g.54101  ORF Transcript_20763/g.54101 Transcript_20763/m.54101 type:complete len:315 (-) Transcript_20763:1194-2138(-)
MKNGWSKTLPASRSGRERHSDGVRFRSVASSYAFRLIQNRTSVWRVEANTGQRYTPLGESLSASSSSSKNASRARGMRLTTGAGSNGPSMRSHSRSAPPSGANWSQRAPSIVMPVMETTSFGISSGMASLTRSPGVAARLAAGVDARDRDTSSPLNESRSLWSFSSSGFARESSQTSSSGTSQWRAARNRTACTTAAGSARRSNGIGLGGARASYQFVSNRALALTWSNQSLSEAIVSGGADTLRQAAGISRRRSDEATSPNRRRSSSLAGAEPTSELCKAATSAKTLEAKVRSLSRSRSSNSSNSVGGSGAAV